MKTKSNLVSVFIINNLLLLFGFISALTGLVLQLGFHIPLSKAMRTNHNFSAIYSNNEIYDLNVMNISYANWSSIHKFANVFFLFIMIYHVLKRIKIYKHIITKKLYSKNKVTLILTALFILSALTGLIPWIVHILKESEIIRKTFIEIHDKIGIILCVLLIIHVYNKQKWYKTNYNKILEK